MGDFFGWVQLHQHLR